MRLGFTGTQSCGKSTLVNSLKEIPEFKDYHFATERSKYLRDLGIPLNTDSTLKGQTIFLAERCSELIHQNIITDRSIIDVIAFTLNAKGITNDDKELFEHYASSFLSEYDYIFYVSPEGVDIEDNGVRTVDPQYRIDIDNTILNLCEKYKFYVPNIVPIFGSHENRLKMIKSSLGL